jgi:anti-sigma factor (TIGR02949 family)
MARQTSRSPRQPMVSKSGPRGNTVRRPLAQPPGKITALRPVKAKAAGRGETGKNTERCRWVLKRLQQFIENEFEPAEREAIQRHLKSCPDCRREYEAMRSLVETLEQSRIVTVPASFRAAVMDRIHSQKKSQ